MTRRGHVRQQRCGSRDKDLEKSGGEAGGDRRWLISFGLVDPPHRSFDFMFQQARQQHLEAEEGVTVARAPALSGSDSCAHSCSQLHGSDVEERKAKKRKKKCCCKVSEVHLEEDGSQSTVATEGCAGGVWLAALQPHCSPGGGGRKGVTMAALATQSSFSTGLDQGQAESSSTNLQQQALLSSTTRRSCHRSFLQEQLDQQQESATPSNCKRRRNSADQEAAVMADINSANSISATSPANSCDKHIGEQSCAKNGDEEIDNVTGKQRQAVEQMASESAAAAAGTGAGAGTTSMATTSRSSADLKCRETMFVSSSNSSNPVTECTNNGDADACKSASPTFLPGVNGSAAQQQQQQLNGAKECEAGMAPNQRQPGRGDCPDEAAAAAWRRSDSRVMASSAQEQVAQAQEGHHPPLLRSGSGGGSGHFPIFDTGAANKRFKVDVGSPSHGHVLNGITVAAAGPGAVGSRQVPTQHAASIRHNIPSYDKRPQQDHDQQRSSSSTSWLQLGMASSSSPAASRQIHAEAAARPGRHGLGQGISMGRGGCEPDSRPAADHEEQDKAAWMASSSQLQLIRPGACPPPESILTADLGATFERPAGAHHRRNGSFTVADNSAFSAITTHGLVSYFPAAAAAQAENQKTPTGYGDSSTANCAQSAPRQQQQAQPDPESGSEVAQKQSRYRVFLEETSAAAAAGKDADADCRNYGAGAATDSSSAATGGVSLGLSMFPPSSGTRRPRDAEEHRSSRDGHLFWPPGHPSTSGGGSQGRRSVHIHGQESQMPGKVPMLDQSRMMMMNQHGHGTEQMITVHRPTAPARNSWLPNGMKQEAGSSSGSPLVRSGSSAVDHHAQHNLTAAGMSSNGPDHVQHNVIRLMDPTSIQSRQAVSAANQYHGWHMVTMQQGPGHLNAAASYAPSPMMMGRAADANQSSRSWEEVSRHGADHQGKPAKPAKPDDQNWQMMLKRAHAMNSVAIAHGQQHHQHQQFQQQPAPAQDMPAARSHSARSLPPPPTHPAAGTSSVTGGVTTMQFLNNVQATPAMEPWQMQMHAQQRPAAQTMGHLPTPTAVPPPPHYNVAPGNHMNFPVPAGPWSHKFGPHAPPEFNNYSPGAVAGHGTTVVNPGRENHFAVGHGQPSAGPSDFLASFQHPGRALTRPLPQRVSSVPIQTASGAERSSLMAKRLADRLHPPGLWFFLQPAAENKANNHHMSNSQGVYMRIRDGKMPVAYLKRYLVNRLGLQSESEVEISCKGQPITPNLPLQHVRDSVWFSGPVAGTDNAESSASERPAASSKPPANNSSGELLMVLTYHRLQFPQR